ncbi:MAG: UDP-glucose 6-dehydrogenase [Lentisphaerae bacterium RIFOXYB12_FULL_65_16]|nr:MAG: UDP-glucose 6-dehydrogenase [Lentisphaerae bacterium RIFOXYA12_64_32]OGV87304.1 MAG: UDP-glucose 6-dehydrogenase [Lentisphaerae bacterium RIFOXYB12_FULL_65_16]
MAKRILCIGAGYVGTPTMAVIADNCPECDLVVVDVNADKIRAWQSDNLPLFEPGLLDVLKRVRGRNLLFSSDVEEGIRWAEIIFVSVNTPTKTFGEGAGMAADLQYWEKTARQIGEHAQRDLIVVEKSTLPVRSAAAMERILAASPSPHKFEVVSNPEFLAEGTALRDLQSPDRVLIGAHDTEGGRRACEAMVGIYRHWVPAERILTMNVWSSELGKLAANAFLAQRVSSINSIAEFCEVSGADVQEVARAVGTDSRISPKFLQAGPGFGGSCFRKDILNLVYLCRTYGLTQVADYWEQVVSYNEHVKRRFVKRIVKSMFNTAAGKPIAILGFAFKANTGDTRNAPSIDICLQLLEERAELVITDPQALENAARELQGAPGKISFQADPYAAAVGAHALAVLTEWDVYRTLDYARIFASMAKPAAIFDARNALDHRGLFALGFDVYPTGKPPLKHE